MRVQPMKPMLKAPRTILLTPECDEPLSTFAFKFDLRRSNEVELDTGGEKRIVRVLASNIEKCESTILSLGRAVQLDLGFTPG